MTSKPRNSSPSARRGIFIAAALFTLGVAPFAIAAALTDQQAATAVTQHCAGDYNTPANCHHDHEGGDEGDGRRRGGDGDDRARAGDGDDREHRGDRDDHEKCEKARHKCEDCAEDVLESLRRSGQITRQQEHRVLEQFEDQCNATACIPNTCAAVAQQCGPLSDGCGGTLECGTCGAGLTCTGGQCVGPACAGPGPSHFMDDFNRPDGPLGPPYLPSPIPGGAQATIQSNEACSDDHGTAIVQINSPATDVTVDFDFRADDSQGLEALAAAADLCGPTIVVAGTDGGQTPPTLQIQVVGSGTKVEGPTLTPLVPGTVYHISATFQVNGIVMLRLFQGLTPLGTLTADIGMSIAYHQAGAIVGRSVGHRTCIDNLALQDL
jgi:hypothetical protein